jgi:uncharacterized protein YaaN involved in tellurite resistance
MSSQNRQRIKERRFSMQMNKKTGREENRPKAILPEIGEAISWTAKEPVPPKKIPDGEAKELRSQAMDLVKKLEDAAGSKEMELLDGITNVGLKAQRNAARQLDLLKTPLGTLLKEGGTSRDIADGLRDLRLALNEIQPGDITRQSMLSRVFGVLPFFNGRYNVLTRALHKIALRYEPIARQITAIETRLRDGRALLVRDNVELRKLYEDVETQQLAIQRNAYLGEMLMQYLSQLIEQTNDPVKLDRVRGALHDVAMRVQDLRTMEEVHIQYFVSIEMSRQNNTRLGHSVDRTLTLTTNVVTVGLAIQMALIRQKKVMEATRRTREFLGDLIIANATAIRRHTEEIGDLYKEPVIAIEKITQAHNELVEALISAGRLQQEGIETIHDNISRLSQMSTSLEQRFSGLLGEGKSWPDSVEASS